MEKKMPYLAATVTAVIFGFSFLFSKDALQYMDLFQLLGARFAVAFTVIYFMKLFKLIRINIGRDDVKKLVPIAFLQPVLYFIFETIGVRLTTASESGIIISLVTVSITIFAVALLKERLTGLQWSSVAVSVAGVVLIVISNSGGEGGGRLVGIMALLAAVVAAGLYNVLSRKASAVYKPLDITYIMMAAGALIFNTIGVLNALWHNGLAEYSTGLFSLSALHDVLYLGVLSSVGAFFMLNYALSRMEASKSAVIMNLTPVTAVLAGVMILGEQLYLLQVVGAVFVLAGVWGISRPGRIQEHVK